MTQNERVINYLTHNAHITQFEATSELGILRLASRINDLKNDGWDIGSEMVKVTNRFGEDCRVARYALGAGRYEFAELHQEKMRELRDYEGELTQQEMAV